MSDAESDISVSTLLGFETFAIFLWVPVSVLENLVSEKRFGIGFLKFGLRKKGSVSVSQNLVSVKRFGIGFLKFGLLNKMFDGVDG